MDALAPKRASRGDVCIKCGESRGAIRREKIICWDGYDDLGRHRFKPWPVDPDCQSLVY